MSGAACGSRGSSPTLVRLAGPGVEKTAMVGPWEATILRRFRRGRLALALLLALVAQPLGAQQVFLSGIDDLPLMPGLTELPESGVVFDKPSGRIVETYAEGPVTRESVIAFYRRTLPQLGWRDHGMAAFRREGEQLALTFLGVDGDLVVRFTLQPQ